MFLMLRSGLGDTKHIGFEESKITDSLSFGRGYFISYSMKYPRLKGKNKLTSRKEHLTMLTSSAFAYSSTTLFVLGIGFKPPSLEIVWLLRSSSSLISLSMAASFSDDLAISIWS